MKILSTAMHKKMGTKSCFIQSNDIFESLLADVSVKTDSGRDRSLTLRNNCVDPLNEYLKGKQICAGNATKQYKWRRSYCEIHGGTF